MGHGYRGLAQEPMSVVPAPRAGSGAYSHVVPNGAGVEYIVPFFQAPDVSGGAFAWEGAAFQEELSVLEYVIEGRS